MRITKKYIYISHLRYPSEITHSTFAIRTCEAFVEKGLDIEIWVPKRINSKFKDVDIMEYFSVQNSFVVKRLLTIDLMQVFPGKWPFFLMTTSFNFSVLFYAIWRGLLKRALFYIHDIRDVLLLSLFNPNLVFETHDYFKSKVDFLNKMVFPKIKGFVATNSIKVKLLEKEYGIPKTQILRQPNAVDVEKFQIKESKEEVRKKLSLPLNKKIVLYAGSALPWKGTETLVEVSNLLPDSVQVVMVGLEGESSNRIFYAGRQLHKEIPLWFNSADILILPNSGKSYASRYETSPVKLFEYMAVERPIIASDLPSIRDVVNESMIWFFEPDNSKDLAEKIMKVLENPDETKIKKSKEEVKEYTWSKRANNILKFINSLDI